MVTTPGPVVAGVDSSTQSTKVELRRLDTGEVIGRASSPHPATTPPRSEQDPAAWWQAFETAWSAVGAPHVAAISVAGQQHGMVVLDADGQVIRPAKLWNDTESAPTRAVCSSSCPTEPPVWLLLQRARRLVHRHQTVVAAPQRATCGRGLAHVLLPHDWLTGQLARSFTTDRGDASGTGYWSPATGEYRWDILGFIDRER